MSVRLYDYMAPGRSPGAALQAAASDIAQRGGDQLYLPPNVVEVNEAFTIPATVALVIPFGGQIKGNAVVTILGQVTSESAAPFSGSVQSGA